ncbi:hypothetical protein GGS20DRAFT_590883 [Poronia punctata]|nr:hypothetical protein GGS20DRAFT_590883 [Poronia punctata]
MEDVVADNHKATLPKSADKVDDKSLSGFRPILNPTTKIDHGGGTNGVGARSPESSSVSSVNPDMLGDEIIVGTHGNGDKHSPFRVVSDAEDGDIAEEPVSHYPKRKRASVYNDLGEDKMDLGLADDGVEAGSRSSQAKPSAAKGFDAKCVVIGYWRDSPVPNVHDKHAVVGFMDVRDRLRTRIQNVTRFGESINQRLFPIPPGPGGGWVTFERIVFEKHLVGLDHNEIKEFVKVVAELGGNEHLPEAKREELEREAVREARRRLELNPPAETTQPAQLAWGLEIPDNAQISRHEAKRRRLTGGSGVVPDRPVNALPSQTPAPNPPTPTVASTSAPTANQQYTGVLDTLPGTRPTRILVGCWSKSDVTDDRERHAVYGILGANDMFRVKLVRETLDGRYVDGNFPAGAGALWIPYEEVLFLNHISHLTRPEMKEYVRVRQRQIDDGEKEDEKIANETKAVYEAQTRAALQAAASQSRAQTSAAANVMPRPPLLAEREEVQDHTGGSSTPGGHELRHHRRDTMPRNEPHVSRHPLPQPELRHLPRPQSVDIVDRIDGLAAREVTRMEAMQQRHERQHQSRLAMGNANVAEPMDHLPHAHQHRPHFQENRERMQKIWASQEQNRIRAGAEDAKMHMGIKYERKQNGPFAGKLVSQGAIITIDGEDYVEYRVLTKPSFF